MQRFALTLGLLGVTILWGGTFVAVQDSVRGYSVLSFLALRFALAALALTPFAWRGIGRREVRTGVACGLFLALGMLLQTEGLRSTTATSSGFITGTYVVFAPLVAWLALGERAKRRIWAAVALSVAGLALIAGGHPGELRIGDVLTLFAAICFGVQIALLSRYSSDGSSAGITLVQVVVCVAVFAPAMLFEHAAVLPPRAPIWGAIALTGVGATAFGFWMQTFAQQRIPAGRAAVIMAIEPVWAAITGHLFAGDRLTPVQWAGAVLMLLSVVVAEALPYARLPRRKERAPTVARGQEVHG